MAHDGLGHLGARTNQVLAVVEDDEDVLGREDLQERVEHWTPGLLSYPECMGDRGLNCVAVGDCRQLDKPHAVARPIEKFGCHLKGETGLAGSTGAGERDEPGGLDECSQLGEFPRSAR